MARAAYRDAFTAGRGTLCPRQAMHKCGIYFLKTRLTLLLPKANELLMAQVSLAG